MLYQDRFTAMSADIEEALLAGEEAVKAVMDSIAEAVRVSVDPVTVRMPVWCGYLEHQLVGLRIQVVHVVSLCPFGANPSITVWSYVPCTVV